MNKSFGTILAEKRREKNITQKQLAEMLCVTEQAVSRWERDVGLPDVSLLSAISKAVCVNISELLSGERTSGENKSGNLKKIKFYRCEKCDNIIFSLSACDMTCCGEKLSPLSNNCEDEEHNAKISFVEDELYAIFDHTMEKSHYLTFVYYINNDRVQSIKLYPEQTPEIRFKYYGGGKLYYICSKHGLFVKNI